MEEGYFDDAAEDGAEEDDEQQNNGEAEDNEDAQAEDNEDGEAGGDGEVRSNCTARVHPSGNHCFLYTCLWAAWLQLSSHLGFASTKMKLLRLTLTASECLHLLLQRCLANVSRTLHTISRLADPSARQQSHAESHASASTTIHPSEGPFERDSKPTNVRMTPRDVGAVMESTKDTRQSAAAKLKFREMVAREYIKARISQFKATVVQ